MKYQIYTRTNSLGNAWFSPDPSPYYDINQAYVIVSSAEKLCVERQYKYTFEVRELE